MRVSDINHRRGCALCDATWGEYWDDVDGQRMVFCCDICAAAFKNMIEAVKGAKGWDAVDRLVITGNNSVGRKCTATSGGSDFRYYIKFHNDGRIFDFHQL